MRVKWLAVVCGIGLFGCTYRMQERNPYEKCVSQGAVIADLMIATAGAALMVYGAANIPDRDDPSEGPFQSALPMGAGGAMLLINGGAALSGIYRPCVHDAPDTSGDE